MRAALFCERTAFVRDDLNVVRRNGLTREQADRQRQDAHERYLVGYPSLQHQGVGGVVAKVAADYASHGDALAATA